MVPMDVKSLTWVGNVYQKFEAMCLEVEEIMYQDTLKYVENQVESVGATFKNFYTDVMEDLVPPTDDDKKRIDADSPALNYTDTGGYRKQKSGARQVSSRLAVEKDSVESKVVTAVPENVGHTSTLHRRRKVNKLSANSSKAFAKGTSSNFLPRQITDDSLYLNSIQERLQNNSRGERSGAMPPIKKNMSTSSSSGKFSTNIHEASDSQMTVSSVPASSEVASLDLIQKSSETKNAECHVSDILPQSLSYDVTNTINSDMGKETEVRSSHAEGTCATDRAASPVCSLDIDDALCRVSSNEEFEFFAVSGRIHDKHVDAGASYMNITDQVVEAMQHDVEVNFEECVLVDEEELPVLPCKVGKQKDKKKGMRKFLSSRTDSARRQEYEQLATLYGKGGVLSDCGRENPTVLEIKVPSTGEVCETEWELL